jgi:hypothetical protein
MAELKNLETILTNKDDRREIELAGQIFAATRFRRF